MVLLAEEIENEQVVWLRERCEVLCLGPQERGFEEALARAEGLVVRTYTRVDEDLLAQAPRLRAVARAGVGLDNIDLRACSKRGVRVLSTPDANTQSVVEFVLMVVLDALRPAPDAPGGLDLARWKALRTSATGEHDLADLTVGILGLGRIGSRLARALGGLGVASVFHDIREIPPSQRFGAREVSFDDLLRMSDVLSVHVDGRRENRHLIDARACSLLREWVVLVNTSRGFVVDPGALAGFLRGHPRARAILDVHDPEPIASDSPLLGLSNVRLTPHIAGATRTSKRAMSRVVEDLWEVLAQGS